MEAARFQRRAVSFLAGVGAGWVTREDFQAEVMRSIVLPGKGGI